MIREQTMRLEKVDSEGFFRMTLATEGEASDGDILSIEGMRVSPQMPLLLSHANDPTAIAGSVTQPEKELKANPPRLRATGQIEMGGTGTLAEIRRDVAMMINKHGGAVSIRWDELEGGKPPVRRMNLPSDHPHFVADDEPSWKKRNGWFWPTSKALEGSIVALGADSAATIGGRLYAERADETEGEVSKFWRAMADDARREPTSNTAALAQEFVDNKRAEFGRLLDQKAELEAEITSHVRNGGGSKDLARMADIARSEGMSAVEIINAVTIESDGQDFEPVTIGDTQVFLPQRLADQLAEEREARAETKAQKPEPDPEPAPRVADQRPAQTIGLTELPEGISARDVSELLSRMLDKHEENIKRRCRAMIDARTGKV